MKFQIGITDLVCSTACHNQYLMVRVCLAQCVSGNYIRLPSGNHLRFPVVLTSVPVTRPQYCTTRDGLYCNTCGTMSDIEWPGIDQSEPSSDNCLLYIDQSLPSTYIILHYLRYNDYYWLTRTWPIRASSDSWLLRIDQSEPPRGPLVDQSELSTYTR